MSDPVVQGFLYQTIDGSEHIARHDTVCQIVRRADQDADVIEYGPAFLVRFSDGVEVVAYAWELSPWYPV